MEQIPIRDGDRPDNVVPMPGNRIEPGADPTSSDAGRASRSPLEPLLEQSARILIGFVSATATALADALRGATPHTEATEDEELPDDGPAPVRPNPLELTAGATVGLAIEMTQAAVRAATAFADSAGPVLSWLASPAVVRRGVAEMEGRAQQLSDRWTRERPLSEEAAAAFATRMVPELTNAILDRVDLTQIAIDRIDIDRVVETIDLDEIVRRVDLDAVIDRVDLVAIADQLIAEIDLPELIRESTGAVTSETVRSVRMRSADADMLLARVVDRLLRRRGEPGATTPEEPAS